MDGWSRCISYWNSFPFSGANFLAVSFEGSPQPPQPPKNAQKKHGHSDFQPKPNPRLKMFQQLIGCLNRNEDGSFLLQGKFWWCIPEIWIHLYICVYIYMYNISVYIYMYIHTSTYAVHSNLRTGYMLFLFYCNYPENRPYHVFKATMIDFTALQWTHLHRCIQEISILLLVTHVRTCSQTDIGFMSID